MLILVSVTTLRDDTKLMSNKTTMTLIKERKITKRNTKTKSSIT